MRFMGSCVKCGQNLLFITVIISNSALFHGDSNVATPTELLSTTTDCKLCLSSDRPVSCENILSSVLFILAGYTGIDSRVRLLSMKPRAMQSS